MITMYKAPQRQLADDKRDCQKTLYRYVGEILVRTSKSGRPNARGERTRYVRMGGQRKTRTVRIRETMDPDIKIPIISIEDCGPCNADVDTGFEDVSDLFPPDMPIDEPLFKIEIPAKIPAPTADNPEPPWGIFPSPARLYWPDLRDLAGVGGSGIPLDYDPQCDPTDQDIEFYQNYLSLLCMLGWDPTQPASYYTTSAKLGVTYMPDGSLASAPIYLDADRIGLTFLGPVIELCGGIRLNAGDNFLIALPVGSCGYHLINLRAPKAGVWGVPDRKPSIFMNKPGVRGAGAKRCISCDPYCALCDILGLDDSGDSASDRDLVITRTNTGGNFARPDTPTTPTTPTDPSCPCRIERTTATKYAVDTPVAGAPKVIVEESVVVCEEPDKSVKLPCGQTLNDRTWY